MTDTATRPGLDLAGFEQSEHDINGVRTVVLSIGAGPVLVFLHGTGTFTGVEAGGGVPPTAWSRGSRRPGRRWR